MYGSKALRRLLDQKDQAPQAKDHPLSLLEQISPDAPMDDATITVWNGRRWVAWDKWLANAPIIREEVSE